MNSMLSRTTISGGRVSGITRDRSITKALSTLRPTAFRKYLANLSLSLVSFWTEARKSA